MFQHARLKLTAQYLLIIMAISIAFSTFIYLQSSREFDRVLRIQRFHLEHPGAVRFRILRNGTLESVPLPLPDPQVINEAKQRLLVALFGINSVILLLSSLAGYFLAGQTLKPIQEMIDEQNRFITDASHELNTPITAMKTTLEVNLRNKNLSLIKAKSVLKSGLEEVNNLQALSEELMQLSKYQNSNGNFVLENLLLQDVFLLAMDTIKPLADKKHIEILTHISKTHVLADKKSLVTLFIILLDNAIKYSADGKKVFVSTHDLGQKISIQIVDQGQGIDAQDIPYIFDRFYRVDKSRTKLQTSGYGLGLSIAKRIISLHNGSITVKSTLGKGSTFTVDILKNHNA